MDLLTAVLPWVLVASPRVGLPGAAVEADAPEPIDGAAHAIAIDPAMPAAGRDRTAVPQALGDKVLFVNFDGAMMQFCGNNDPHDNCSTIFQGMVLPYSGDAAKRAAIVQIIRERVADFGITVTNLRPEAGDYDMGMVGDWQGENPAFAGVAPNIDCGDGSGGEVSFTLEASGTADGIAEIVLQEAAHTWGLEHVNDGTDLLYPTTSGVNKTFVDACAKIVSDTMLTESGGLCNGIHTQFCDSGWQNSHAELLLVFGPSQPDTVAPTVSIVSPQDGATLPADFPLVIAIADDQSPVVVDLTVTLTSDALAEPVVVTAAYPGPDEISFPLSDLPEGTYTIAVDGLDESDNAAGDSITVSVGTPAGDSGSSGAAGDSGSSGAATAAGGSSDDGGAAEGTAGEADSSGPGHSPTSDASGCACAHGNVASPTPSWLLLLLLTPLRRRRGRA
ncbi:MAG: hypothetical protein K1X88_23435 [Nannocystaceae bacterium]|nr:hypothetical protein [Nannocystaceae bacterium]